MAQLRRSVLAKFMMPALLVIVLVMTAAGIFLSGYIERSLTEQADDQIDREIRLCEEILATSNTLLNDQTHAGVRVLQSEALRYGSPGLGAPVVAGSERVPNLSFGQFSQANNYLLVDKLRLLTGGSATFFVRRGDDFVRLSTNITKSDGSRAVGTLLDPAGKAYAAVKEGKEYYGIADILGQPSITGYAPMMDAQGKIIGIWFTGYAVSTQKALEQTITQSHVLEKGFVALVNEKGKVLFHSDHVSDDLAAQIVAGSDPSLSSQWKMTSRQFAPWGYTIIAAHMPREISGHVQRLQLYVILAALFAAGLLSYLLYVLTRRLVVKPIADAVLMMEELGKGHFGKRLASTEVDEIGVLSNAMDAFADDLQQNVVGTLKRVAAGDLTSSVEVKDEADGIRPALNSVVHSLNGLVREAAMLADNAVKGDLSTRGNANQFEGGYRDIIRGFNNTLDAVITPLTLAADYVDQISRGEIPERIRDEYYGDFNTLKESLNRCVDGLAGLIEANGVLQLLAMNDVTGYVQGHYQGIFADVAKATNIVRDRLFRVAEVASNTAIGEYDKELHALKSMGKRSENDALVPAFVGMMEAIDLLVVDVKMLSKAGTEGRLGVRADAERHEGKYREVISGINEILDAVTGPINNAARYMAMISKGEIPETITEHYHGDFNAIIESLNTCIAAIGALVEDTRALSKSAVEGRLAMRADANKHRGDFREIIVGVNETLDALLKPVEESSHVLAAMAGGDLTSRMSGEYLGDHRVLKDSVNTVGASLERAIKDVAEAVSATASASMQISSSAEELAAGVNQQSAQAEEVSTAVEEMSTTIRENSLNAKAAAETADTSRRAAEEGGRVVEATVGGMRRIAEVVNHSAETVKELGRSSNQIGEIIAVIDDIADQTNLLALNAAIEAARAGDQGRGFAVVADEVRKLAERTTKATKEIAAMIRKIQSDTSGAVESMKKGTVEVESGITLADKAGTSLGEIVKISKTVTDMVSQIAGASEEQSTTSDQISKNIIGINSVTSQTAAGTEQIARAAEDLSRLTENLQGLVSRFKLTRDAVSGNGGKGHHPKGNDDRADIAVRANGKLVKRSTENKK